MSTLRPPLDLSDKHLPPSFFLLGQDAHGHWLAVETHGRSGGLFASREAAIGYIRHEAGPRQATFCAAAGPLDLMFPGRQAG